MLITVMSNEMIKIILISPRYFELSIIVSYIKILKSANFTNVFRGVYENPRMTGSIS